MATNPQLNQQNSASIPFVVVPPVRTDGNDTTPDESHLSDGKAEIQTLKEHASGRSFDLKRALKPLPSKDDDTPSATQPRSESIVVPLPSEGAESVHQVTEALDALNVEFLPAAHVAPPVDSPVDWQSAPEVLPTDAPTRLPSVPSTLTPIRTSQIWGVDFGIVTMRETLQFIVQRISARQPSHMITANLNFLMLRNASRELVAVANRADLIVCDGMPILFRSRFGPNPLPERVAGADLIYRLSEQAAALGHRVFLLGAAEGVAEKAAKSLVARYPGLQVAGTECPPFRQLSTDENSAIIKRVRDARADILLVAFGQPKGELWIDQHLDQLKVPVCIQLGASFDFVAGNAKRAPRIFQRLGCEWLHRALTDPQRLIPRYAANAWYLMKNLRGDLLNATK
jgi:N-acetylglucosaminyldiphosphoundecaprenol N-acetyl-beta-D-mannosaminyltransferase